MLTIIQIIAILQGLFLGITLFQRRHAYKTRIFWLFMGCIISIILFAVGDDDYNLIVNDANWFLFHEALITTFFFLFLRFSNRDRKEFTSIDLIFIVPYLLYAIFQSLLSFTYFEDNFLLEISAEISEFCLIGMLIYSIYDVLKHKKNKQWLVFLIPFTLIFLIDEATYFILDAPISLLSLDSYGVFLIAIFLFYFITYQLIIAPKDVLPSANSKYKLSNLSESEVEVIKKELHRLMVEEQLFKNQKLNVNEIANQIGITRQQLSEVLNVHMGMRFQDLLNQHRVEAFIKCLSEDRYKNFTLLGIATEVGFSSKSSFNATFKKLKGITPSQYKKQAF